MSEPNASAQQKATILNREGFHSRPVMKFVELAQTFASQIRVRTNHPTSTDIDGKSAMELMLLGATAGTQLIITANGHDAQNAVAALADLVSRRFGTETL